ncbi:DUF1203 domain-containing protein [Streptomyces sp. NPDC057702]|uniref:DUF1203 domain-containing protein n=1 Tax=unclassified Streptomyces TaxID=2593676 RepID=UPI003678C525
MSTETYTRITQIEPVAATEHSVAPRYEIRPISPEAVRELRVRDDAGQRPREVADEEGGAPLRCCLGRSTPGERLLLVSYAPLRRWAAETGATPGAYDEVGPVFIHREPCAGWPDSGPQATATSYPAAMVGERRVLRAYSARGEILGGRLLIDGSAEHDGSVDEALEQWYADPRVAAVHIRAVEYGCFHAETRRVG